MRRVPERQLVVHWRDLVLVSGEFEWLGAMRYGALECLFDIGELPKGVEIYGAEYIEEIDWSGFVAPGYP